ncbi:hypothetical protein BACUNI_01465 [Bacteroides uniformis ATCC 8492]|uniref:Uncharacterized protein n=1 Tax=Bacteroides uniformis (strain ATCC 8492 / DSM 6597 / CCUG 4942 / CIP 103695 / JCM 5828 / KCTC 5204 / NCTC 13054 / VPI 0061) TaxID=411479 RepID=A0ABC9NE79_BACUC|nr:hypothetical protein BACUNI_01465 [Bacteroides uniformis ATCC 8492]
MQISLADSLQTPRLPAICKGFLVWNRCHGDMLFTGLKYS